MKVNFSPKMPDRIKSWRTRSDGLIEVVFETANDRMIALQLFPQDASEFARWVTDDPRDKLPAGQTRAALLPDDDEIRAMRRRVQLCIEALHAKISYAEAIGVLADEADDLFQQVELYQNAVAALTALLPAAEGGQVR